MKRFLICFCFLILCFTFSCKKEKIDQKQTKEIEKIEVAKDAILTSNTGIFDIGNLKIVVTYNDATKETVDVDENMITKGYNLLFEDGTHEIEITYQNKTCKAEIKITTPVVLSEIKVTKDSILDAQGESFDLSNIEIELIYSDGSKQYKELTKEMITKGYDKILETGTHEIEITYQGKTCKVNISFQKVFIEKIEISKYSKLSFEEGKFNPAEITILATNNLGASSLIPTNLAMYKGAEKLQKAGVHTVVITYQGKELNVEIEIKKGINLNDFSFTYEGAGYTVTGYFGENSTVEVPNEYEGYPVTKISEKAFYENDTVTRVILPNTITSIGEAAFYKAGNLESVVIPSSVVEVGKYALRDIKIIYTSLQEIPTTWNPEWYDSQHAYIHFDANLSSIALSGDWEYCLIDGKLALTNYYGDDTEIVIPDKINEKTVEIIGGACFKGNENITSLTLANTIKVIQKYGIAECTNLTTLTLSTNLEIIGECGIRGCGSLTTLKMPNSLKEIGTNAFNQCAGLLEIIVPEGVVRVGTYAFSWCTSAKKIYLPSTLETIGTGACYSCSSATIYTPLEKEGALWESGWNMSNRKVIYSSEIN